MSLTIAFENSHFVIIDKPVAMLSVPSRLGKEDPRPVAGILLQDSLKRQIYPVHRLDEDVSGLLMFALTAEAAKAGNAWFEKHEAIKTYEAISIHINPQDLPRWQSDQTWESRLMRGKKRAYEASFGKPSKTTACVIGSTAEGRSVWRLQPLTGRSHQLRYEMARHGFPIDGDELYGSTAKGLSSPGIDLRAIRLQFELCANREKFGLPPIIELEGFSSNVLVGD